MIASPKVFMIHGWATNHHIFDDLRARAGIAADYWQTPDLPGHGTTPLGQHFNIEAIAQSFAAQISQPVHLLGWSLGGMIALSIAAHYPEKVQTLCLTASLAKLSASPDYPQGLQHAALQNMVLLFEHNYTKFIQQFLTLQMLYATPEDQQSARKLLPALCQYGTPAGLTTSLHSLQQADLRPLLPSIQVPTLLIFGGRDTITPPRMGEYLHQHISGSQWQYLPKAAHLPFLSHPDVFTQSLHHFWEQHS
ncbi:pimeloyl-ACP methyl ester esterase BioH [Neisseriaceae bacterium ESL0693]|nr:pimeloyl-ACP methyl ester esterase BioH [Neisseriaceae bacterium ESL0693]